MKKKKAMKVVIPGGSGQVGMLLGRAFNANGHEVVSLSRRESEAPWRMVPWDGETLGDWAVELEGADVVINLAGHTVNSRYSKQVRKKIIDSRVRSTQTIAEAISLAKSPPALWLQMNTATIYEHTFGTAHDEANGVISGSEENVPDTWRFSIEVARAWEQAVNQVDTPDTRKVILRSSMIMSPDRGGIFDTLLTLVRFGLGGRSADGRQFLSWIHDADFIRVVNWLIAHDEVDGIVNVCAPNPLPNKRFMAELRKAWGIPFGLPAARWMLEIGTFLLRTETELVLKSRRVVPGRLLEEGFEFKFPKWGAAAVDLCSRWRGVG